MAIGLIIIGDEILSGKRADKHFPKVVELLAARGLQLAWAEYLGDDPARISATLQRTLAGDDIVFSCGGTITRGNPRPLRLACRLRCMKKRWRRSRSGWKTSRAKMASR